MKKKIIVAAVAEAAEAAAAAAATSVRVKRCTTQQQYSAACSSNCLRRGLDSGVCRVILARDQAQGMQGRLGSLLPNFRSLQGRLGSLLPMLLFSAGPSRLAVPRWKGAFGQVPRCRGVLGNECQGEKVQVIKLSKHALIQWLGRSRPNAYLAILSVSSCLDKMRYKMI